MFRQRYQNCRFLSHNNCLQNFFSLLNYAHFNLLIYIYNGVCLLLQRVQASHNNNSTITIFI